MTTTTPQSASQPARKASVVTAFLLSLFLRLGVLPFFLFVALLVFAIAAPKFLGLDNIINVARQSVYLILVSLGQMIVLITGGFDLSVGTAIAMTSVVSATTMVTLATIFPDAAWLVICFGILAGFAAVLLIGALNASGVALFGVSPFIMTLGMQTIGAGIALFITGGVPVTNLPFAFGDFFGFGTIYGIPVPVLVAIIAIALVWGVMNRTRIGVQIYAVGGNVKAAHLSGIDTKRTLFAAYLACSFLAAIAGLLLTARVESGETNLGGTIALESIAACVIAGVSLRGGIGRVENVVLGAFFIVLVQNGMNIMQIGSYMQMILLGTLLVLAVIVDQIRYRMLVGAR